MMTEQITSTAVPRLRFPEFRKSSGWGNKTLTELCEQIAQGGTPDTAKQEYWNGDINWLTPAEMGKTDGVFISSTSRKITEAGLDNCSSSLLPPKSVIVSTRAPIGHLAVNSVSMAINQGCKGLVPGKNLDYAFLFAFLSKAKSKLIDLGAGNTFKELSGAALKNFEIAVPGTSEQKKIADCLMSLNEVIAAQEQKVEALKAHKRGLMQQLFPREGEARPLLRFPEFRDAPEWKSRLGGELFENRKEEGREGLPIYSVTMSGGMIPRASFERDFYDIEDPAKNKLACKGDIAYNMMRMWQGAQGVAFEDCLVSPAYAVLAPLEGVCSSFFAYLFKLPQSLKLLTAYSRGLTKDRLRLYFDDFARIPLCVPKLEEQQRIADGLSSLDTQIAVESECLIALKAHKQGLMQQLFPTPETVSA